jgi:WD40 repeat protein
VAGRIHVYDAATNAEVRALAGDATGVTQVAVSDDRQWVYYLQSGAQCGAGTLMRTLLDGTGTPEKVSTSSGVRLFAIAGPHGQQLVTANTTCAADTGETLDWTTDAPASGQVVISTQGLPPMAESVAISPDGRQLASYVRGGMQGGVAVFDLPSAHSSSDANLTTRVCSNTGADCATATYASDGDLISVASDGQHIIVYRNHGGQTTELFRVAAAFGVSTVDLDPTGTKVLLTDGLGHAWMWNGSGSAKALPGTITDASW